MPQGLVWEITRCFSTHCNDKRNAAALLTGLSTHDGEFYSKIR